VAPDTAVSRKYFPNSPANIPKVVFPVFAKELYVFL
jgi:hypothetical protein